MPDSQYKIKASFTGVENVVRGFKSIEVQVKRNTAALREQMQLSAQIGRISLQGGRQAQQVSQTRIDHNRRELSTMGRLQQANERFYRFGREARYVWREQTASLRVYTEEAMRLARSQAQFKAIGLSPDENEQAFRAARDAANKYNLDIAQTVDLVTDLHTATGHLSTALEALPSASKFKFAFSTLFGERFSPQMLESQIQQAFKYLEMTGAVNKGQAEMEKRFNVIAQMMSSTGGRVRPSDLLQMAQRGGPAVQSLSIEGLRTMAAPLQELKAAGAGTSLMSVYSALGGQLTKSAAQEFAKIGLLKPKAGVKFTSAGIRSSIARGAFGNFGDKMMEDPLAGADMLMEAMKSHGVDTTKDNAIRKELRILFQNRTAQRLMSILTTQRGQVVKERQLTKGAMDIQAMFDTAGDTPMGKMEKFQNALANLRMEMGGPLLGALTKVAGAAMPFLRLAAAHPDLALTAMMTFKVAQGVSAIAAISQSSGLARLPLTINSTTGQLMAANQQTSLWRRQLGGIPGTVGTIVTLSLGVAVIGYLEKLKAEAEEAWEQAGGQAREQEKGFTRLLGGKGVTPEKARALEKRNVEQSMATFLHQSIKQGQPKDWSNAAGWGVWLQRGLSAPFGRKYGMQAQAGEFSHGELVQMLKQQMPGLARPGQFAQGLQYVQNAVAGPANQEALKSAMKEAFPGAWSEVQDALKTAGGDYYKAVEELVKTDQDIARRLTETSDRTIEQFGRMGDAAERAAQRLAPLAPPTPAGGDGDLNVPELPSHARGGITRRRHIALLHQNEAISPLSELPDVLRRAGALGGGRGPVNINVHVDGSRTSDPEALAAAIARKVHQVLDETGLSGLTHDGFRNRALSI
jgi:hypothetical protein